jgi:CHAT domain-containing protein
VLASLWKIDDLAAALLLGHFAEVWSTQRDGPAALAETQAWLRTQTAGMLARRFDEERRRPESALRYPYALMSEAWQRFTFDYAEDDCPFGEPIHWAAFTYTGL